jgi:hypothetical protein
MHSAFSLDKSFRHMLYRQNSARKTGMLKAVKAYGCSGFAENGPKWTSPSTHGGVATNPPALRLKQRATHARIC